MASSRRVVLTVMAASVVAGCGGPAGTPGPPTAAARRKTAGSGTPASPAATPTAAVSPAATPDASASPAATPVTRAEEVARYGDLKPSTWGFGGPGVIRALPVTEPVIALTFDACGGPGGSGYDQNLIDFLRRRQVPATLFLNSRWIDANMAAFRQLAGEPLFEIANHGTWHRPLSVTGRSAYGIAGTRNAGEVYDEVSGNHAKLTQLLGSPPRFFRPGTAYSDDIAVRIVSDLQERVVTFSEVISAK